MTERPHGPTSGVKQAAWTRAEPPPDPPRELERELDLCRVFTAGDREWLARPAGKGAGGTGAYGLGMMVAVHFFHMTDPATPLLEALLPAGRFAGLFDAELRELLEDARPIVSEEEARQAAEARGRRRRRD